MRDFEARAIENIATAPATRADRGAAAVSAVGLLVLFVVTVPFARVSLPAVPAALPAIVGTGIVGLVLSAVLLYVQYRIERDVKLALLALAYAASAVTQALYLLTFPGVFAPEGLLGAGPQTAPWFYVLAQVAFAGFVLLQALVAPARLAAVRVPVRFLAIGTGLALLAVALWFTLGHDRLPAATVGARYTPQWVHEIAPSVAAVLALTLVVTAGRLATVTQVWLAVVLLARLFAVASASVITSSRFSLGWYAARVEELIAAVVMLAVFLVKINDLMLRLAARNRSATEALAVGQARYASLANVVPQLIWTADPRGEIEYVNDRWVQYTGKDLPAVRAGALRDLMHPEDEPAARARWMHCLRSGEPYTVECRLREGASRRYRWFLVNAVPVRAPDGTIVTWIGTSTDVDAQKRLEEREAFLARAGERLGASLDLTATIAAMRALIVPRLAERSWTALLDDDGRLVLAGFGSTDVAEELDGRRWVGTPLQPALHDALLRVLDDGEPLLVEHTERYPDPWLLELAPGAAMIAPLLSGDVRIGALLLVRTAPRTFDRDDVSLLREFTRRAALSLEHARLYERERATADALQRAMLPAQLPQLPDVHFSESYSAATESQRVGGDFYDAFTLPGGQIAVAIGDVTGHGLEAAVVMGEIRQAIRASAFEAAQPSTILDRASHLLVASGRTLFVTAIFGLIDPVTGRFTYATAGHPPPLLQQEDELRRLPSSGLPIGLRDDDGVDFALRLHAPCTLVLYTDGLLEFARDIADAERRIDDALTALGREDIPQLAGALGKRVLGDEVPTDDIAILTVTIDRFRMALPGDEREWGFAADDGRTAALVRREIAQLSHAWTGREDARFGSELAFGELIANVVRHAPGRVHVTLSTDGAGSVVLEVEDNGAGFVPGEHRLDPLSESGRGLGLVHAVADGVRFERAAGGGTRVLVSFGVAPLAASA